MPHFAFNFPTIFSSHIKFHDCLSIFAVIFSCVSLKSNGRIGSLGHIVQPVWATTSDPEGSRRKRRRDGEAFPMEKHSGRTPSHTGSAPGRFRVPVSHVFGNGVKIAASSRPRSYHRLQPHSYSNQDQKVMWTVGHFGVRDKDEVREEMVRKKAERERDSVDIYTVRTYFLSFLTCQVSFTGQAHLISHDRFFAARIASRIEFANHSRASSGRSIISAR